VKSFEKSFLDRLTIPHGVISVIRRIGEYKGKQDLYGQQAPEVLENLRRVAIIQSTESSNRLEGITADQKRIQELIEEKATPEGRAESEIAGYRDVLNQIHINFKSIPLSSQTLLRLQGDDEVHRQRRGSLEVARQCDLRVLSGWLIESPICYRAGESHSGIYGRSPSTILESRS